MRINYDSVCRDAKKLRALADECEAAAKTCTKYQNEIPQYWEGDSADAYVEGLRILKAKNQKLAKDIERAAALILETANEIDAEDRRQAAKIKSKTGASSHSGSVSGGAAAAAKSVAAAASTGAAKNQASTLANTVNSMISKLFGK